MPLLVNFAELVAWFDGSHHPVAMEAVRMEELRLAVEITFEAMAAWGGAGGL